ncbi:MAG: hypothetical protein CMA09_02395 [Euryarchaeota archaeon]|nr:hypothetical protein [Euryarchaeota archaeon]
MSKDNGQLKAAFFLVFLMILAPFAAAANVNTFGNGNSTADIELRDGTAFINGDSGAIHLPAAETVTSASMDISTEVFEHSSHSRIDLETMNRVWNPMFNGNTTQFSNIGAFQIEDGSNAIPVQLDTDGFLTDFEEDPSGFEDRRQFYTEPVGWDHSQLDALSRPPNSNIPDCAGGEYCWGTGLFDDDYTALNGNRVYVLTTPPIYIDPAMKTQIAYFDSWHDLDGESGTGPNPPIKYRDCAYVEIRESSSANALNFYEPTEFEPIDLFTNLTTGIGYGAGYYQVSSNTNTAGQIDARCNGKSAGDFALGGTSTSAQAPNGWANVALDLGPYVGKHIQLQFVMEDNNVGNADGGKAGWYIDNFRVGDLLPQAQSMTFSDLLPSVAGGQNHPNGYGIVTVESEVSSSATITVDVLDSSTKQIVHDTDGNQLKNLEGKIVELWDVNSTQHPKIDLRFNFDSGSERLSSPVFHGFSIGTRVGTGFNQTSAEIPLDIVDGVWQTLGNGESATYSPILIDTSYNPPLERSFFDKPITQITPYIQDDCAEVPLLDLYGYGGSSLSSLVNGTTYTLDVPIYGFEAQLSYTNACNVGGMWFDLTFGHHAESLELDVGGDGVAEWGFNEPAFGAFGMQNQFLQAKVDNINYGQDSSIMSIDSNGVAEGGTFMLPKGAEITSISLVFDEVGIYSTSDQSEGFNLSILSGTQEEALGDVMNSTLIMSESLFDIDIKTALNSLMENPIVPINHYDSYGNEWLAFRFRAESPNATTGAQMTVRDLQILYNYSVTIDSSNGFAKELNKGVALWDGGSTAEVEMRLSSTTGGKAMFSNLQVTTSAGYENTISLVGNPSGLYPNGAIYEIITTHAVSPLTGAVLDEATLTFESSTGNAVLSYTDALLFYESSDLGDIITLQSSSISNINDGKQITWRFTVNSNWEDCAQVRIYSGLLASNGVNGLPDATLLSPSVGNAVENDAVISSFSLVNNIGIVQNLDSASTGQVITLNGSIRLQDLSVAPNPSSYFMILEQKTLNTTGENITIEWITVANRSGIPNGDFSWNIDLGQAAGEDTYRFRLDGYEGGETLCPEASYRPDSSCGIPFNVSIDTLDPDLLEVRIFNGLGDLSNDDNWRIMVDDTWVVPSTIQRIRLNASDLPSPPETMNLKIWVEYDHDQNSNGIPEADEYITVPTTSDGEAPFANYTATFNDIANVGQDPVGRVSVWVESFDKAGNSIDGGAPGFENDHFTYVSMNSKSPVIRNFFVDDSQYNRFLKSNQQQYEGKWNQTMYAGNEYHLIVEANDDNGWRDVDYFRIDLSDDRTDMTVYYAPRNDTAWTNSPYIEILPEIMGSGGPQVLSMDGATLINPFESDFYLDLPIRMTWGLPGATTSLNTPVLYMKDLDNSLYRMLPAPGRHIQDWYYSDGIQLDFRADSVADQMISPIFTDLMTPITQDVRKGFVYPGDVISFEGQYAYLDGITNGVYINPEIELTLEITRAAAGMDGAKGYIAYPGEVFYHSFTGGTFDINITAPPVSNDYQYSFRLCPYDANNGEGGANGECGTPANPIAGLPMGAIDTTTAICSVSDSYGCSSFNLKVDATAPRVVANSWTLKDGNQQPIANVLPTSTYHCVDIEVLIEEQEALFQGDVAVAWSFFTDPTTNTVWPTYRSTFGDEPMTQQLTLNPSGGSYFATADCVDLWPITDGQNDLNKDTQINSVEVVFWIDGKDSAGTQVLLGGGMNDDGGIGPIFSSDPSHRSMYELIFEEASFSVKNVRLTPEKPEVGDEMELEIEVLNTGTLAGSTVLNIRSVVNGGVPVFEGSVETGEIAVGASSWVEVDLQQFNLATTGMYYLISDNTTDQLLYNGSSRGGSFNVQVESQSSDSSGFMLILTFLIIVVAVLATLVVVLLRRSSADDYGEYEDEDDKAYAELPGQQERKPLRGPPPAAAPQASVSPEMARAMEQFPQWTQDEIQGYFDQGWNVETLQDWVNNQ